VKDVFIVNEKLSVFRQSSVTF